MHRLIALLLSLAALLPAACAPSARPFVVPGSEDFTLGQYRILVAVPEGPAPQSGWPVIYALDGGSTFATMVAAVRQQGGKTVNTGVVPAVVVGIAYPTADGADSERRGRDLTPTGAEDFFRFIETSVKAEIEGRLPIDRRRQALFGHSFGGLFVLRTLFNHPDSFQSYTAASPSIWWGERAILADADRFLSRPLPDARLLVMVGEYDQALDPARPDIGGAEKLRQRRMVDNARELAGRLEQAGLPTTFSFFPEENHGSIIPAAISRAVRFAAAAR